MRHTDDERDLEAALWQVRHRSAQWLWDPDTMDFEEVLAPVSRYFDAAAVEVHPPGTVVDSADAPTRTLALTFESVDRDLTVVRRDGSRWTAHDEHALTAFGEVLGRLFSRREDRFELERRRAFDTQLARISESLSIDRSDANATVAEALAEFMDHNGIERITLFRLSADSLQVVAATERGIAVPDDELTTTLEPLLNEHLADCRVETVTPRHRGGISSLVVPMLSGQRQVGGLIASVPGSHLWTVDQREALAIIGRLSYRYLFQVSSAIAVRRSVELEELRTRAGRSLILSAADPEEAEAATCSVLTSVGQVFGVGTVAWLHHEPATSELVVQRGVREHLPSFRGARFRMERPQIRRSLLSGELLTMAPDRLAELGVPLALERDLHLTMFPAASSEGFVGGIALVSEGALPVSDIEFGTLRELGTMLYQYEQRSHATKQQALQRRYDRLKVELSREVLSGGSEPLDAAVERALASVARAFGAHQVCLVEHEGPSVVTRNDWCEPGARESFDAMRNFAQGAPWRQLDGAPADGIGRFVVTDADAGDDGPPMLAAGDADGLTLASVPIGATGTRSGLKVMALERLDWGVPELTSLEQIGSLLRQFIDFRLASEAEEQTRRLLEFEALHDALTGLGNRRMLTREIANALPANGAMVVMMIDLDRFKVINDSLGHSIGDELLRAVSDKLRMAVRGTDTVCRFGGDEFAIVISGEPTDDEVADIADRLVRLSRTPVRIAGSSVVTTISIGMARGQPGDDAESLLRHADAALAIAKSQGRDQAVFFDDTSRDLLRERLDLEVRLRKAVIEGEIVPWFQPEYNLLTGEVEGFEALARWEQADQVVPAGSFIGVVEEAGLAPEMSRIILERTCAALKNWRDAGVDTRARVNIAPGQLQSPTFVDELADLLGHHGLPTSALGLELTEHSLMIDVEATSATLRRLRDLGVEVAIDDFGTGFSSLAWLKDLPVDTLKIDQAFVAGVAEKPTDLLVVNTILDLADGLGLHVVAEGIEMLEQAAILRDSGCTRGQGWLWSAAVPAGDVPDLVARRGVLPRS